MIILTRDHPAGIYSARVDAGVWQILRAENRVAMS